MKKENLLIVCFDIKDFNKIDKIDLSNYDKVVVASDDFRVHEECESLDFIYDVTFIQRAIPYTKVAGDVIKIIQKINMINKEFSRKIKIFDYKVLEWVYHVEGGQNTQKIQDMLLYLESIDEIISKYFLNEICIISNSKYNFISNIISLYAEDNNIIVKKTKQNKLFKTIDIKELARPFYYLLKTISIKFKYQKNINKSKKNIAIFWLFNSASKHINNIKFINDLLEKAGFNPLAFSWRVGNIEKNDINIQRIESYISWKEIFNSATKIIQLLINQKTIKQEITKNSFYHKNIRLDDILVPIILKYILVESPDSYRFSCGFKRFSNNLDVEMISGNLNSQKLGNIVESILPVVSINKFAISNFLTGKNIYYEFRMKNYPINYWNKFYYFVQNKIEKDRITKEIDIKNNKVVIYGSNRASNKNDFLKDIILEKFSIPNECKYIMLIDYSNFLFGYQSISEVSKVLISVLNKFKSSKSVCLLIKPHPSASMTLFYSLQRKYRSDNIKFLNKKDNIDELLFISDILISKYSTVGIEAIKYNTLVVSPQLCKSDYFRLYGEYAFYKNNIEELNRFLDELVYSKENFEKFKKQFIQKSQKFIHDFYVPLDENIIIKTLKGKK